VLLIYSANCFDSDPDSAPTCYSIVQSVSALPQGRVTLDSGLRLLLLFIVASLAALAGISVCAAAALTPADQQLFREAHAAETPGGSRAPEKLRQALERAHKLGWEGDTQTALFLLDLGNRRILYSFAEGFKASATPELELEVMKHLRDPAFGICFSAGLLHEYQLRALYDALLAQAGRTEEGWLYCARAMVRTNQSGIEADLAEILPRLDDYYAQTAVAQALVDRKYGPAEPALIDWLQRSTDRAAGSVAWIVVKLDSPGMLNALVRRLARLKGVPPSPELESTLTSLIAAILYVTPQVTMDRTLLPQKIIDEFPSAYQVKVVAMMKDRATVEAKAGDMNPENLAHWIAQGKNERVRAFIAQGVDVNTLGKSSGDRPLHVAVKYGNVEAVDLLLAAGADPNGKDWRGVTPLRELAGRKAHDDSLDGRTLGAAKVLLARGADPSMPAADTMTPLHLATAMKFTKMVELLVEGGANVNAEATELGIAGLTATQIAVDHEYGELAAYLRSRGGKVNHGFLAKRAAQRAYTKAIGPFLQQH
jgi:Ankyrin repeats (3 copies)/Ankyrin repeat